MESLIATFVQRFETSTLEIVTDQYFRESASALHFSRIFAETKLITTRSTSGVAYWSFRRVFY